MPIDGIVRLVDIDNEKSEEEWPHDIQQENQLATMT
jgi:hypothetical protein